MLLAKNTWELTCLTRDIEWFQINAYASFLILHSDMQYVHMMSHEWSYDREDTYTRALSTLKTKFLFEQKIVLKQLKTLLLPRNIIKSLTCAHQQRLHNTWTSQDLVPLKATMHQNAYVQKVEKKWTMIVLEKTPNNA